jgi:hypothetical protein
MRRKRVPSLTSARPPAAVYRFCSEEAHADTLCRGGVWISTLEACRGYEDPQRGDKGEGTISYNTGFIRADGSSDVLRLIGARAGIDISPACKDVTLSNNTRRKKLPDAYVVCSTLTFAPERLSESFGRYCVRIRSPRDFFAAVTERLTWYCKLRSAHLGGVVYQDRHFRGLEAAPGPVGFVKPSDQYRDQQEFRFLWVPAGNGPLCQFSLSVPGVADFCDRVA